MTLKESLELVSDYATTYYIHHVRRDSTPHSHSSELRQAPVPYIMWIHTVHPIAVVMYSGGVLSSSVR
jgi:hypothetical protein